MKKADCPAMLLVAILCFYFSTGFTQSVYFDDSSADNMILGNDYFELTLRKSNGSLSGIVDKTSGQVLSSGNDGQTMWLAEVTNPDIIVVSHEYGAGTNNGFNYLWDENNNKLTLSYIHNPAESQGIDLDLQITASDQHYFDLYVELIHCRNDTITFIHFPCDLIFQPDDMQEAIMPWLPGVRLNENFFHQHRSFGFNYPGVVVFSDYGYYKTTKGQFSCYTVVNEDVTPFTAKFFHYRPESNLYAFSHANIVSINRDSLWKSPNLRMHIGNGYLETVEHYREDTGMAASPSLAQKLGEKYQSASQALTMKYDPWWVISSFGFNMTNHEKYKKLWQSLPGPSLLTVCSYPRGGQDESNPDILPIDPALGTNDDFRIILESAREFGHLIMPYVNPTFWDDESETVQSLQVEDFALLSRFGQPWMECYDGHCGYAVCPYAPAVINRLNQLMEELTTTIPVDMIWQDQIARAGLDYNKHMPDPAHTAQGWLEHFRRHQDRLLMGEHGYDRQVSAHVGYFNTMRMYGDGFIGTEGRGLGDGNWEYFPIAPMMARDKIFFIVGPDPVHATISKFNLTWAISMGQLLCYYLTGSTLNTPWHVTAQAFQQFALSRFADERMTDYTRLSSDVTKGRYESYKVLTNWSTTQTFPIDNHEISTEGFIITNDAEDLTAGIFTNYNGEYLSTGDHYIIESRYPDSIVVRHPQGEDTSIRLIPLTAYADSGLRCYAFTKNDVFDVPVTIASPYISFGMNRYYDEKEVTRYVIAHGPIYLTTPALTEPMNWATVPSTSPVFRWETVVGALSYQIQITTDVTFHSNIIDSVLVSENQFSADNLRVGTTYFWRVRAFNESTMSTWSSTNRLRVDGINIGDRLVAYYPLDGNPKDSVSSNDGTLVGDVVLAADRFGHPEKAYSFDGEDDYITFSESEPYTLIEKQMTISTWIYPKALAFETGVMERTLYWFLLINEDGTAVGYIFDENHQEGVVSSTKRIPLSRWSHFAYTYDGKTIVMYLDGKPVGSQHFVSQRIGKPNHAAIPALGRGIEAYYNDFNGIIDDVRVYDRALSAAEMAELYRKTATENFSPEIVTFSPTQDTTITEGDSLKFIITAWDEDDNILFCTWLYDDAMIANDTTENESTIKMHFPIGTAGKHNVKVLVSDGDLTIEQEWIVTVEKVVTALQLDEKNIPTHYSLGQNYPNPFNAKTSIRYGLPAPGKVSIELFNIRGERVKTAVENPANAGYFVFALDGSELASGIYVYKIQSGDFIACKKLIVLK
ncbi:T9SS C-terminal target domain-containing protein [candidate division KSB1 bacterium]|nr:T9SS type A sorting domain-containing protein [candidate division KSB1 bacterium]RQW05035.1 MAG: T9SS C-terminal target domain-containing protein [candidate division KSB1 bacterium]